MKNDINLNGIIFSKNEIIESILNDLNHLFSEINSDTRIIDIKLIGPGIKGNNNPNSDFDILLEFDRNSSEYHLFNIIAEQNYTFNGIKLEINPIKADKSGTTKEWLVRNNYL